MTLYASGETSVVIATAFPVSPRNIRNITGGRTWTA
jgi:hypothetical protein